MASNTPNLNLYKKDPVADASDTFNITTMLNENWDKIDAEVGNKADSANLSAVDTRLTQHLGENNASKHFVTRSVNLTGVQIITTLPNKKIQSINARAFIDGTTSYSIGGYADGQVNAITKIAGVAYASNALVGINSSLGAGFYATVQNINNGSFELNWQTETTSYNGTGTVTVQIDVIYHGEVTL